MSLSQEALQRKARSQDILRAQDIKIADHLPMLAPAAEIKLRSADEIVNRIFCLIAVAAPAVGGRLEAAVSRQAGNWKLDFSPQEQLALKAPRRNETTEMVLSWSVEAAWALLWAIQRVPALSPPEAMCDINVLEAVIQEGPSGVRAKAKPRAVGDILDATDLAYRYHWATRNAGLNSPDLPRRAVAPIVFMRHRALNWLTGIGGRDWDRVSTDT
jgi:uncharacterized protein DUF4272